MYPRLNEEKGACHSQEGRKGSFHSIQVSLHSLLLRLPERRPGTDPNNLQAEKGTGRKTAGAGVSTEVEAVKEVGHGIFISNIGINVFFNPDGNL